MNTREGMTTELGTNDSNSNIFGGGKKLKFIDFFSLYSMDCHFSPSFPNYPFAGYQLNCQDHSIEDGSQCFKLMLAPNR